MTNALIFLGIVLAISILGLGIFTYIDMYTEVKITREWINAYREFTEAQDRLIDALREKIRLMEAGADNG